LVSKNPKVTDSGRTAALAFASSGLLSGIKKGPGISPQSFRLKYAGKQQKQ